MSGRTPARRWARWLRWPAAICHGAHNVFLQGVFDRSTIDTGRTKWITTEFGFGLTIVSIIIAVYFWRRRDELPSTQVPRN